MTENVVYNPDGFCSHRFETEEKVIRISGGEIMDNLKKLNCRLLENNPLSQSCFFPDSTDNSCPIALDQRGDVIHE